MRKVGGVFLHGFAGASVEVEFVFIAEYDCGLVGAEVDVAVS